MVATSGGITAALAYEAHQASQSSYVDPVPLYGNFKGSVTTQWLGGGTKAI